MHDEHRQFDTVLSPSFLICQICGESRPSCPKLSIHSAHRHRTLALALRAYASQQILPVSGQSYLDWLRGSYVDPRCPCRAGSGSLIQRLNLFQLSRELLFYLRQCFQLADGTVRLPLRLPLCIQVRAEILGRTKAAVNTVHRLPFAIVMPAEPIGATNKARTLQGIRPYACKMSTEILR